MKEFSCEDSSGALHFKFNRFSVEHFYDYLSITSENFDLFNEFYNSDDNSTDFDHYYDYSIFNEDQSGPNFLVLTGEQETDVWVIAESIQSFGSSSKLRVTFFRQGFEEHFFMLQTN